MELIKHLPAKNNLKWPIWRTINRLRVGEDGPKKTS